MEHTLPQKLRRRNRVIPNGVDQTLFAPRDRAEARSSLGWSDEEPVVLFAADPSVVRKRFALAQAACSRAARSVPNLRLEIANKVNPEAMPDLMNAADCLLLTSIIEGSPNVVKEALMCNLPVVSTDVGDVKEQLSTIRPSFVCEARDDALADALVACVDPPSRSTGRSRSMHLRGTVVAEKLAGIYRLVGVP